MKSRSDKNHRTRRYRIAALSLLAVASVSSSIVILHAESPSAPPPDTEPCLKARAELSTARTPEMRQAATVRLAECLLSIAAAKPLSMELMGDASGRRRLLATADEALSLLRSDAAQAAGDRSTEHQQALRERIDMLRAFATTFRAIAANDESDASKSALMTACVELAIYTDDADRQIATSAKLWQAAAYRRAGRADRTLQMMWPALARNDGSIADFFARLERCRALSDAGRHVASATLAIKIEGRIDEWLSDESQDVRRAARGSVRQIRAEITDRWADALKADGHDEDAASARASAGQLRRETLRDNDPALILDTAVADMTTAKSDARHATSQPNID